MAKDKNINDLLMIENYINDDYTEFNIENIDSMKLLCCNDILVIELISTNNILKVFYTGQDDKYIFVCNIKETDGFMALLTNKFSFKILKENIKRMYRRSNINYNIELKFLYEQNNIMLNKIKKLEELLINKV
jgi:hypothetical protein